MISYDILFRLVSDLSLNEQFSTSEVINKTYNSTLNQLNKCVQSSSQSLNDLEKWRKLPSGKKCKYRFFLFLFTLCYALINKCIKFNVALENLCPRRIEDTKQKVKNLQPYGRTSTLDSTQLTNHSRWILNLSTDSLLELKTDYHKDRALSLKLINNDIEHELSNITQEQNTTNEHHSWKNDKDFQSSLSSDYISKSVNFTTCMNNIHPANVSDSGVSSSLQSPTISTNSDCNECSLETVPKESIRSLKISGATHRALYKFCARHSDELNLEIGDPICVHKVYDDQWSEGKNIRTGDCGIFPSSLATEVTYNEFINDGTQLQTNLFKDEHCLPSINFKRIKRERFLLEFLGSIEVNKPKDEKILNEVIDRFSVGVKLKNLDMVTLCKCVLEITDNGLRLMDESQSQFFNRNSPTIRNSNNRINRIDYFFSFLQIIYYGYQPKQQYNFFAFITRHPSDKRRYACHVFRTYENTREVEEAVKRAFYRFFQVIIPLK